HTAIIDVIAVRTGILVAHVHKITVTLKPNAPAIFRSWNVGWGHSLLISHVLVLDGRIDFNDRPAIAGGAGMNIFHMTLEVIRLDNGMRETHFIHCGILFRSD